MSHHQHNKFNRRLPSLPSSSRLAASSAAIWTSGRESEEMEIAIALSASLAQQHLNDLPPDERPLNGPTECIACLERLSPSSFPTQRIASACDHSPRDKRNSHICISCLATHLDVQLRESGPTRFTCPICNASLTHSELKQWASRQTFARIDLLQARNTLSSDPNFVWCSNPRCGAGQVHTTGSACPIVTCRSCKTRTCFNHQIQWHEGLTCHEFDHPEAADQRHRREKREEAAFTAYQQGLKKDLDRARRAEKKGKQAKAERILDEFIQGKGQQQQQQRDSARRAEKHRRQTEADRERAERALRRQEEKKGEAEVLRSSKPCPGRECGYRVYKIDGCKHMTCEFIFF